MALTPMDIHHKEFRTSRFGGYNEEDVDTFLDQVADELEKLLQEMSDQKQQVEQLKARLCEFEEMQSSLQNALLAASKSAEEVREDARVESETVLARARDEADILIENAQRKAREITMEAEEERKKMERSYSRLRNVKRRYLQSIKEIARDHLAEVEELEAKDRDEETVESPARARREVRRQEKPQPLIEDEELEPRISRTEKVEEAEPVAEEEAGNKTQPEKPAEPAADEAPRAEEKPAAEEPPRAEEKPAAGGAQPSAVEEEEAAGKTSTGPPPKPPEDAREREEGPASSNLVDEVLAMDEGKNIYDEIGGEEQPEAKGRRSRKDKREKHFFWE
jgi:cell division initiation protein